MSLPIRMLLVGLCLYFSGGLAPAGAETREAYLVKWRTIPRDADQHQKWRSNQEMTVSVNIRPETLVTLDRDFTDGKKRGLSLGASSELALLSSDRFSACALMVKKMREGYTDIPCFVDDDRDGKFEKFFTINVMQQGFIPFYGFFPRSKEKYHDIDPIPYHVFKEDRPGDYPSAFLKINGFNDILRTTFDFDLCFASASGNFVPSYALCGIHPISIKKPSDGHPSEIAFFGGKIIIDKINSNKLSSPDEMNRSHVGGGASVTETESFKEIAVP